MKIKDFRNNFVIALSEVYESEEILSFFYMLSEQIAGLTRVDIALSLEKELTADELLVFSNAQKRLLNQEPIQYIIGETEFYGLPFFVSQSVLIPRPETEELVDWIVKDAVAKNTIKILDIGTGSGCIAISLAKNLPHARVYAMDVSEKAIQVAIENAKKNEVEITFMQLDVLNIDNLPEQFDVIVSNPPYVRELEKREMKSNVLDNEPHLALFVPDKDALVFYEKITELAKQNLAADGLLYFEINQYLGKVTKNMIENKGFKSVLLRKDLYTNDRMIRARFN